MEGAVRRASIGRGEAEVARGQTLQTDTTVSSDRGAASTGPGLSPVVNGAVNAVWPPGGQRRPTGDPSAEETSLTGGPRCSNFLTQK
jgi:hypothetical protein